MPILLPEIMKALTQRAISPPISMYLRMLLGAGQPMTKLPPALEQNLQNLSLRGAASNDDDFTNWALARYGTFDANPNNLGYSDYSIDGNSAQSPDIGGLRAREMSSQQSDLMTMRSLGNFRATPVGSDSVRISDSYDFENDTQAGNGLYTSPYIQFAQKWGVPYNVESTIAAPKLNAQLRARAANFALARKRAQKQFNADLFRVLGGGK